MKWYTSNIMLSIQIDPTPRAVQGFLTAKTTATLSHPPLPKVGKGGFDALFDDTVCYCLTRPLQLVEVDSVRPGKDPNVLPFLLISRLRHQLQPEPAHSQSCPPCTKVDGIAPCVKGRTGLKSAPCR
ncbi:MAG: hypothetical protein FD153_529 [Rhodospirillaceae bacterium]|nr:MAG: hypothetical protein FD153_529 [Rhodospirillaceae bacterium]